MRRKRWSKEDRIAIQEENDTKKIVRSLKRYCPKAYRDMLKIRYQGIDTSRDYKKYELSTSDEFKKVYGQIYAVMKGNILVDIIPRDYFYKGYMTEYMFYKGLYIPKDKKEMFKVDLLLNK